MPKHSSQVPFTEAIFRARTFFQCSVLRYQRMSFGVRGSKPSKGVAFRRICGLNVHYAAMIDSASDAMGPLGIVQKPKADRSHLKQWQFKKGDPPRGNAKRALDGLRPRKSGPRRISLEERKAQDYLPGGKHKQTLQFDPEALESMRQQAAKIAVDMERGIYINTDGSNWKGGYSRTKVARDLGYTVGNGILPKPFESPDFERAVEWERIKRDASYRVALKEALPQTDVVLGGLLHEAQRRVLSGEVRKIDDRVLFGELRQYMAMKSQHEASLNPRGDIHITINDFRKQIEQLPAEAREVALGLFANEMRMISDATKVVDGMGLEARPVRKTGRPSTKPRPSRTVEIVDVTPVQVAE